MPSDNGCDMKDQAGLEMKYFVIKPCGKDQYAKASRAALRCYADYIESQNPRLAHELRHWAEKEKVAAYGDRMDRSEATKAGDF